MKIIQVFVGEKRPYFIASCTPECKIPWRSFLDKHQKRIHFNY